MEVSDRISIEGERKDLKDIFVCKVKNYHEIQQHHPCDPALVIIEK